MSATVWILSVGTQHEGGSPVAVYADEGVAVAALKARAAVLKASWTEVWEQCQRGKPYDKGLDAYLREEWEQREKSQTYMVACDYATVASYPVEVDE